MYSLFRIAGVPCDVLLREDASDIKGLFKVHKTRRLY